MASYLERDEPLPSPFRHWTITPRMLGEALVLGPGERVEIRNESGGVVQFRAMPAAGEDHAAQPCAACSRRRAWAAASLASFIPSLDDN